MSLMELRVFGAPGCGKSTHLAGRIAKAVEKFGEDKIMVTSFTRAAAKVISNKVSLPKHQVGTLHSIMYHLLDEPELTESHLDEWNTEHPRFSVSNDDRMESAVDQAVNNTIGNNLYSSYMRYRAQRKIDRNFWRQDVQNFGNLWEAWKKDNNFQDFSDLIEIGINDFTYGPNNPEVIFVDEAQDFTALEMELVRKWADKADYIMMGGDDDQMLYDFTGASADTLLNPPIPEKQKFILDQSYRLPRVVHKLAEKWISQLKIREPKKYMPRDFEGELIRVGENYKNAPYFAKIIFDSLKENKSIMILASCSYMLQSMIKWARDEGLIFHNPYAQERGDWNPLGKKRGVTAVDRLLLFLLPGFYWKIDGKFDTSIPPVWSIYAIEKWIDNLESKGVLIHGAKKEIENMIKSDSPMPELLDYQIFLDRIFQSQITEILVDYLLNDKLELSEKIKWFMDSLLKSKRKYYEYPASVIKKHGIDKVREEPKIIFGTIHSVKGGESDNVILFPDLSLAAMQGWIKPGSNKDAIVRQFYVGMTRCKEKLYIASPMGGYYVDIR